MLPANRSFAPRCQGKAWVQLRVDERYQGAQRSMLIVALPRQQAARQQADGAVATP